MPYKSHLQSPISLPYESHFPSQFPPWCDDHDGWSQQVTFWLLLFWLFCPLGISPAGNLSCFLRGKASCDKVMLPSLSCMPGVLVFHTLTRTSGSLMCAQMLMQATAHSGARSPGESLHRKSTLGQKIPCCTGKLNPCQWHAGLMIYQLSSIPTHTDTKDTHDDDVVYPLLPQVLSSYNIFQKHLPLWSQQ